MTGHEPVERELRARRRLRRGALATIVLLAIMNAAGTYLNLYVAIDTTNDYNTVFSALFGSAAGVLHFLVALGLFFAVLGTIVNARRSGDARLLAFSVVGLLAFLVAAYSGYHFIYSGEEGYSFWMEMGFLGVVLAEVAILARLGRLTHESTIVLPPAVAPSTP